MTNLRLSKIVLAAALMVATSGCASLPRFAHWTAVRPARMAASEVSTLDRDYASAVAAISRKDYVRALDLLQAARLEAPNDVRVLNAFGVVYDKLGRFDLSARYYAQAEALDTTHSPILANNLAYSQALQRAVDLPARLETAPAMLAALPTAPAPQAVAASAPIVVRLSASSTATATRSLPFLTGRPLYIANATGRVNGAEPVRANLVQRGWSAPRLGAEAHAVQATTTIRYPAATIVAAQALARTLPHGVRLVDCAAACNRIELTLGADSLAWPSRSAQPAPRRT